MRQGSISITLAIHLRGEPVIDAKLIALRRCENYSPIPVCTILWCRPGG